MSKSFGYKELAMILGTETNSNMLAKGRRVGTYVDGDVKHFASNHTHQLALSVRRTLEVKSTDDTIRRERLIVLHKVDFESGFLTKLAFVEAFEKVAASISVDSGFYD